MTERAATFEVRWVRVVAVVAFLAGLAFGLAGPVVVEALSRHEAEPDADESYVQQLAAQYDLSDAQVRSLRMILRDVSDESTRIIRQIIQGDPGKLPSELLMVRNRADERILVMLTEAQRQRFNRDKR